MTPKRTNIVGTKIEGPERKWTLAFAWGPSGGWYTDFSREKRVARINLGRLSTTFVIGTEFDEYLIGFINYWRANEMANEMIGSMFAKSMLTQDGPEQIIGVPYPIQKD